MTFSRKTVISALCAGLCVSALLSCTPERAEVQAGHQTGGTAADALIGTVVYVAHPDGFRLREEYNSASEWIRTLPQYERLIVLERSPQTETIDGIESYWYMVSDRLFLRGWVFGASVVSDPSDVIADMPVPAVAPAIVTDFTTNPSQPAEPQIIQVGDFVVRDGELIAYFGRDSHVEIPEDLGITRIAVGAFDHSRPVSIRIPREVVSIGYSDWSGAFPSIFTLESIIVDPENEHYTSVDGVLFNRDMTRIIHVPRAKSSPFIVPASITSLEGRNLGGRSRLPSVVIPASVTSIAGNTFAGCHGLTSITVDPDNRYFASVDGVLLNRDITVILHVPHSKAGDYTIPASVTAIAENQFNGRTRLASVVVPAGITRIENSTFQGATSLTSVTLPAGLTHIGNNAFQGAASLASLTLPASLTNISVNAFARSGLTSITIPASVTHIGTNAFDGCASLTSITVEADNSNFASLEGVLFNRDMTAIVHFPHARAGHFAVPASVTTITWWQFRGRTGLTSIAIPASVTSISSAGFDECINLTSFTVDTDSEYFASLDGVLFNRDMTRLIRFPQARSGSSYSIPDTVAEIGEDAFSGTSGLTEVYIPNSVTSIGNMAFRNSGLVEVTIPDSVTHLGWGAFAFSVYLRTIFLPDGLSFTPPPGGKGGGEDFEDFLLGTLNLQRIIVGSNNQSYRSIDGVLYSRDGTTLIRFPQGRQGEFTIPDGVTHIGYKAFYHAAGLVSVTIPASVTSIADFAFDGASSLISVSIPEGVASIGRFAFARASSLISVSIPASVNSIGDFVFYACINLAHVSLDENNRSFTMGNGIIFNRGMTEIAQILPPAAWHHHLLAQE